MKICGIKENIKDRLSYLSGLKYDIGEKIAYLPKENLIVVKSRNRTIYFASNGKERKYITKEEVENLKILQKKNYYRQILRTAEEERNKLEIILKKLDKIEDTDQVFLKLKPEQKNLIEPYIQNLNKKELEKWKNDYMTHRNIADNSNLLTKAGTRVRSKSELIIAERLETYGIPYKYECAIFVGDKDVWFPDFTVLNKRTGQQYLWEHFGMLDNPDYCASAQYKIEKYAKEGFIQGKTLIVTTESSMHSLNTKYIDTIIEQILL